MKAYLLIAMSALMLTGAGCSKGHDEKRKDAPAPVVQGVELQVVKFSAMPETVEVVGTVRARTSAVVSTRIPGSISLLRVREGDRVKKGQVLAQLDARENQAAAAVATAGIDEAQRGLDEAMARKRLAETTLERYQNLFAEQAVTRQELDVKLTDSELARQGAARAEARVRQARENLSGAAAMAGYTRIVAPISGIITSRQADLGATVFPAQPLFTIEDEGTYQLELAIPESMAAKVRPGTPVQVGFDAATSLFDAKIAEIVPASDPASRTFIAKVPLPRQGIKSGMFGRSVIALGTSTNSIMLPRKALVERGGLTSVWIVDKDGIARMRLVKPGKTVGDRVEILAGLSDGERMVVSGTEKVIDGARIEGAKGEK